MNDTLKSNGELPTIQFNMLDTIHSANSEYQIGDCPAEADGRRGMYAARKHVPANSNIQVTDTEYWMQLFSRYKTSNDNDPRHDPNKFYVQGYHVYVIDAEGYPVQYISIQAVPQNSYIEISDTRYWNKVVRLPPAQDKNKNYLVGCAGIIINHLNEFLVGSRVDMDGEEVWALFGGKPEYYETLAEGLAREIGEEVNVNVLPERYLFIGMKEALASKTQRCITAYFATKITAEQTRMVRNLEPAKCFQIAWKSYDELCKMKLWQYSNEQCKIAHELLGKGNGKFDG